MISYYSFSLEDAQKYGVDAAIMLHHLRYWVAKNEANDNNYHDGNYWTYNSTAAFAKLFPFWSARKVGRILAKLEEDEVILSGNYNDKKYDRTKWYTLSNAITVSGKFHLPNLSNAITENVEPIPKYNQVTTQETPKESSSVVFPFESEAFFSAWELWKTYKKEQFKFKYRSIISEQAALKDLAEISNNNENEAIKYINHAIAKGWRGIFARKTKGKSKDFDGAKYRDYIDTL